jgi:hypothetical protein
MYQLIYRYRTAVSLGAIVCAVILATAVSASMAMAQSDADAEWPCIQAYVPEVAAAVIWPEPIEEQQVGGWRQDKELKSFVNRFGALEVFPMICGLTPTIASPTALSRVLMKGDSITLRVYVSLPGSR